MARFTESAVLKIIDESSKPLSKINKMIAATMRASKQASGFRIRMDGLRGQSSIANEAAKSISALVASYQRAASSAATLTSRITSLNAALAKTSKLNNLLKQSETFRRTPQPRDITKPANPNNPMRRIAETEAMQRMRDRGRRVAAAGGTSALDEDTVRLRARQFGMSASEVEKLIGDAREVSA